MRTGLIKGEQFRWGRVGIYYVCVSSHIYTFMHILCKYIHTCLTCPHLNCSPFIIMCHLLNTPFEGGGGGPCCLQLNNMETAIYIQMGAGEICTYISI